MRRRKGCGCGMRGGTPHGENVVPPHSAGGVELLWCQEIFRHGLDLVVIKGECAGDADINNHPKRPQVHGHVVTAFGIFLKHFGSNLSRGGYMIRICR